MPYEQDYFSAALATYVVLMNDKQQVFLLRRTNTSWKEGYYNLPAGKLEQGETFLDAAIREVKEEAGVTVCAEDLSLQAVINRVEKNNTPPDWVDFFYVARQWEGTPYAAEAEKCDHAAWFSLDEIKEMRVVENQKDALKFISQQGVAYEMVTFDPANTDIAIKELSTCL